MNNKYHYFYKITNNLNSHFYYGVHNTNDLDDGYMGSGKRLHYAYKKYGIENFTKEILKFFDTSKEAFEYEAEVVTEELIKDSNCYNIKQGGEGWQTIGLVVVKDNSGNIFLVSKTDERYLSGKLKTIWTGKKHSEESKKKIKENIKHPDNFQKGVNNSQFGTCWIHNNIENKKIKKEDLEQYISSGWIKGRLVSNEFCIKMSDIVKKGKYQVGEKNSQFNTKWVVKDNIEKKINVNEIDYYISLGYKLGRHSKKYKED